MQNRITKLAENPTILHIDLMCNAGPSWSRQLAGMSGQYIYIDSSDPKLFKRVIHGANPNIIVCGGGYWNSKLERSGLLDIYLIRNKRTISFGYWGDGTMSLIKKTNVDIVFCSSIDAVKKFTALGVMAKFSPHPIDTNIFYPHKNIHKIYDWSFIGTNYGTTRQEHLDILKKAMPNNYVIYGQGHVPKVRNVTFEQAANIFRQSKIVLNINDCKYMHLGRYFSDRVLMAMACGSFVLTTKQKYLDKVFKKEVHLDWYKDKNDLLNKIRQYLDDDEMREKIALTGSLVAHNFSLDKRIVYFFDQAKIAHRKKCRK